MMRKSITVMSSILLAIGIVAMAWAAEKSKSEVKYPEGYRHWTHVKSMVIQEGHKVYDMFGGIHHIYANKKAFEALRKGKPYPDGAIFVFDLLTAESKDNAITEGHRKFIGVMQKDAEKFAETGGWGFEGFKNDGKERMVTDPQNCFKCHKEQKDSGYVFSKARL